MSHCVSAELIYLCSGRHPMQHECKYWTVKGSWSDVQVENI